MRPIHGNIAADILHQLMGDHPQGRFAHQVTGTLAVGQGVIEGDLVLTKPTLLAPFIRVAMLL